MCQEIKSIAISTFWKVRHLQNSPIRVDSLHWEFLLSQASCLPPLEEGLLHLQRQVYSPCLHQCIP